MSAPGPRAGGAGFWRAVYAGMPLELGRVGGAAAARATGGAAGALLSNPVGAALVVTALALAIVFAMLRDHSDIAACPWRPRLRCALYLFMGVSLVMALHYYGLGRQLRERYQTTSRNTIVGQIHSSQRLGAGEVAAMQSAYVPVGLQSMYSSPPGAPPAPRAPAPGPWAPPGAAGGPAWQGGAVAYQGGAPAPAWQQGPPAWAPGAAPGEPGAPAGAQGQPGAPLGMAPLRLPLM